MNATFAFALTTLAALSSYAPTAALADEGCDPRVIASDTYYPLPSQLRHQSGKVLLEVEVDENGRARSAQLTDSSGHRLLDRAAANSVLGGWRFDVSACERKDLPARDLVAIEYRAQQ